LQGWGVDRIVAVDVFLGMTFHRPTKLLELIKNAVDIVLVQAARAEAGKADILIAPDLDAFSSTDMKDIPGLVKEGYRAARGVLDQLGP
ncbi:MAG: hypothetical protein MUO50_19455, partial [Longimicrobiales bacterium]|nr:hypothetical protein [Longimicrobiales bacterium]